MLLLIFHLFISTLCLVPILLYIKKPILINNHIKQHILIFIIKLLIISLFIYFFINNFKGADLKLFTLTGYINFTLFHIIEGFILQKIILKNG